MQFQKFPTPQVTIGNVTIGANHPIALQSMTNTDTNNIEVSVEQCIRIFDAGADYVRLTAQGIKEAENLRIIKEQLRARGYNQPLVADIHFNPQAALVAARYVEKVRINPGNYCTIASMAKIEYTDEEYAQELQKIKENIVPLLEVCKAHNTAIRIGVNHGSLSQRIVGKYGDTPLGMAMSMMEFLHICREMQFFNVVCSIKASNTRIMVYATRLLVQLMREQNCAFPIHLGVTEAGADEDGRIKSAVGIGAMLLDGIGDTIRVSLTEAPEREIPVCRNIVNHTDAVTAVLTGKTDYVGDYQQTFSYEKYKSNCIEGIGGEALPIVVSKHENCGADWVLTENYLCNEYKKIAVLRLTENDIENLQHSTVQKNTIMLFEYSGLLVCNAVRKLYARMKELDLHNPVILHVNYEQHDFEQLQIQAAIDYGALFIDGLCDGLMISAPVTSQKLVELSFAILQASRSRFTKTEYISCPSCGRTLFDIEKSLADVKAHTAHFQGLKIAVMGCVVNGPGEMADADFGYVGAGRGRVNLYQKQTLVHKNIQESEAISLLLEMIEKQV
ncbi:MAG: (E)-4-hydroxy-3-methylbut-2-enyl-diphosphate synthase [Bacteroidales bacterium]|jgi:(E)-4-hydroxy-3-methylbut-2-enyl-diphosphate synthase|nr:(E)-4-hydroxy-3-methylbut-2-enyl-diphosphate synthase [Bacteroidales bacterium]